MKKVEAVVRPDRLGEIKAALSAEGYPSMTISDVRGRGNQEGVKQTWRGEEYSVDLLNKTKLEVVVPDEEVDDLVNTIADSAKTGEVGDGKIFVTPVEGAMRIRTGEEDDDAL